MSRFSPLTALALLLPLSLALAAEDKKPDADGFKTIFDGQSLDGWKKSRGVQAEIAWWSEHRESDPHFLEPA